MVVFLSFTKKCLRGVKMRKWRKKRLWRWRTRWQNFLFAFQIISFSIVPPLVCWFMVDSLSWLNCFCQTNNGSFSSHLFCVEHHGMMVKLTRHPDHGFQKADTRQCSEYATLGLFSRIPTKPRDVTGVPPGLVVRAEGRKFVFYILSW